MKQFGPIPPGFAARDGELVIGGRTASDLAHEAGDTPLFVYDFALVKARIAALRAALPAEVALHYAVKANPFPPLVAAMVGEVDGLDVASGGELARALQAGKAAHAISFAGPGKRDAELAAALEAGVIINLESEGEAHRALSIAKEMHVKPHLAVRVNPDFDLRGSGMKMGGGAKPFGVDAARVPDLVRSLFQAGADWRGFHIFAGSQALDAAAVAEALAASVSLTAKLATEIGEAPPHVNLGGGFGIPYFAGDAPLDVREVGAQLSAVLAPRPEALAATTFSLELGRYLVGEAGVYLTRILDKKVSHGETFLITDGGLHHQLAASGNFGTVVRRNYPVAIASRFGAPPEDVVTITGCLCTPLDRLADSVHLPEAEVGDLVALFMAGAYGASASPQAFLAHPPAREILINHD
ncbi:MAG: pyridoxal-dependent decarboxylase, exosortase A system-associated [Alphaproteobacteria bacterium]|nr:pyridoxal-dependent decarboxylase, exosortase A system-associated [Alphaproteobacteria bacterium]MDE2042075.1 pyridoxal-dependent decarboxylase, exosortase A system-associated [Alphaproteobacteria bacterium]MDE2340234.1 pyridoxal-dependent decarboxylase, exosortase A system-associated [Alphaproteobacteria bacterium]